VLMALDAMAFDSALTQWASACLYEPVSSEPTSLDAFALDGKTARGSFDGFEKAVLLLSLLAHKPGLTYAQTPVPNGGDDKTNEHKTALRLLEGLVLHGRVITGDAMFCQRDLSKQVIDLQRHFLDRVFPRHRSEQYRGDHSSQRFASRGALHQTGCNRTVKGPLERLTDGWRKRDTNPKRKRGKN